MKWQNKLESLKKNASITLEMTEPNVWHIFAQDIKIVTLKDGLAEPEMRQVFEFGKTPAKAVSALFNRLSRLPKDQAMVKQAHGYQTLPGTWRLTRKGQWKKD